MRSGAKITLINSRVPNAEGKLVTTWTDGNGVYLGRGLVLTAAHIVEDFAVGARGNVAMDGRLGDAMVITKPEHFGHGQGDIAVLELNPAWRFGWEGKPMPICGSAPAAGSDAVVMSFRFLDFEKFEAPQINSLQAAYEKGRSGSPVVDPARNCVAGILSYGTVWDNTKDLPNQVDQPNVGAGMAFTNAAEIARLLTKWGVPYDTVQ